MNYSFTSTYAQENTTSNSSALLLNTTTASICIDGQIYMDTMFNTYLVNSTTRSCL